MTAARLWVAMSALVLACTSAYAQNVGSKKPAATPITVNIESQPLRGALRALGEQTGLQVLFRSESMSIDGVTTPRVTGRLSVQEALDRLLAKTGLKYEFVNEHTVRISSARPLSTIGISPTQGRLAQTGSTQEDLTPNQNADNTNLPGSASQEMAKTGLDEVVVTGTHIRGAAPIGSPLITITSDDITNSGYSTIGEMIRSLPQVSGGGINPGVVGASGNNNTSNVTSASTVNLRGLGSNSSLTLVNGHRLAFDGADGSVDISALPIAAIERVEVLTDSSSAIYGSDAVAGVANFILKKNYEGAQTFLRYGGATRGGAQERNASQLFGINWGGGNAMLSYEHDDQKPVFATQRDISSAAPNPQSLLPGTRRNSVFASAHQDFSADASAYVDGLYSDRTADRVRNFGVPFFSHIGVTLYGVSPGFQIRLPAGWSASIDGTLSSDKDSGEGADGSRPVTPFFYANRMAMVEAQANGPIAQLSAGPVQVAVGGGYRHEGYSDDEGTNPVRHLMYEFGEVRVPLVKPDLDRTGLTKAELSVSGRHEHYSDFGNSTTPKIGLVYAPLKDLSLRASWGRAFRAPTLLEEYGFTQALVADAGLYAVSNPADAQVFETNGSNRSLKPETARTWSAGLDFKPDWVPGFDTSVTYFNIDYRDRISYPIANEATSLTDPTVAPYIVHNPTAALLASLIGQVDEFDDFTSLGNYDPSKVIAYIDNFNQNVQQQAIHGVDLTGRYRFSLPLGDLDLSLNSAWLHITQKLTADSPETEVTGTPFNPARFRSRLGATWQHEVLTASAFLNYISSETDSSTSPSVHVASWATVDAQVSIDGSRWGGIFHGLHLSLSAQNLFDRPPPQLPAATTTIVGIGFDSTNATALGRFLGISARKDW